MSQHSSSVFNVGHSIMPWQFGALKLKEDGGNRLIKYADALIDGASPNDGECSSLRLDRVTYRRLQASRSTKIKPPSGIYSRTYSQFSSSTTLTDNAFQKCC
jgi:hypothetical protein